MPESRLFEVKGRILGPPARTGEQRHESMTRGVLFYRDFLETWVIKGHTGVAWKAG
jgi:hypothetical protein